MSEQESNATMGVGELSRRLGVSTAALHLWERKGWIYPERTVAGWRLYSELDFLKLKKMLANKAKRRERNKLEAQRKILLELKKLEEELAK